MPICTQPHFFVCHTRLLIAADAPAEAISCFPLTLLVTLGRPLLPGAKTAPVLVRLLPAAVVGPETVDCRRGPVGLLGLAPDMSLCLTAAPFLKLVAGGSGRGRLLAEGVAVIVLCLLIGDSFRAIGRGP
jgi:hypothetical protein